MSPVPLGLVAILVMLVVMCLGSAFGQDPSADRNSPILLTNLEQVVTLNQQLLASNRFTARVTGVITYVSALTTRIFIQEGQRGLLVVLAGSNKGFQTGQRVEVFGTVESDRPQPDVTRATARVIGSAEMPDGIPTTVSELAAGAHPYLRVTTLVTVRDMTINAGLLVLLVSQEGVTSEVWVSPFNDPLPRAWIDAQIEVTGMAYHVVNSRNRVTSFDISTSTTNDIKIIKPGPGTLFERPSLTLGEVAARPQDWGPRYRFSGVVTYFRPGLIYMEDPTGVVVVIPIGLLPKPNRAQVLDHAPQTTLEPGEKVEMIGVRRNWYSLVPTLQYAEYRRLGKGPLPTPQRATARDLQKGRFPGRVVSIDGQVLNQRGWGNSAGFNELLTLRVGEDVVQASWTSETPADWKRVTDSYVRVTGVHESEGGVIKDRPTFQILMRSPADVVRIPAPPFWTQPQIWKPSLAGLGVGLIALSWIALQRRQLRQLQASEERLEERVEERTEELRASEERTRLIVDTALDAVITMDAEGLICGWNAQAESIFGWTREEAIGRDLATTIIPVLHREAHQRGLKRFLATGQGRVLNRRIELPALRRDGREFTSELTVNALRVGNTHIFSAFIRDITDRKRSEEDLLKALNREKELNQLKSNFVSLVSHEFRTPLEVILTSSDILDRYLERLTPERRDHCLSTIRSSVKRMSGMMEDVLLLGRVDAGKLDFKPQPLDLPILCQCIVDEILSATSQRCPVELTCHGDLGGAQGDETLLRHLLTNLLSNAVKYSAAESPVTLTVSRQDLDVIVTVGDSGRGIPAADHARLFQSFQRGSNVEDTPGTGLGLLLVKKCVDVHGGRIEFESAESRGTKFRITLPLFVETPDALTRTKT